MYFYASNLYFGAMMPYRANAVDKRLDNLDNRIGNATQTQPIGVVGQVSMLMVEWTFLNSERHSNVI
jgi:hypothetical protein